MTRDRATATVSIALAIISLGLLTVAAAGQRPPTIAQMLVDPPAKRITLGAGISDDYTLCASSLDTGACVRVGDLRRPLPAGRRWVVSDDADQRLTVALDPMPVAWLVCLQSRGASRCGLASEWTRWSKELDDLHRAKGDR